MKKADVLQLAIIMVGIIFCFLTLQYIFSSLIGIFAWIFSGGYGPADYLTPGIGIYAAIALQATCSWLLITNSRKLAAYLYEKANLGSGFKITGNTESLLYILLIAIAVYLLISNITPLLTEIFRTFKQRASGSLFEQEDQRPTEWAKLVLDIALPCLLLFFAKPIAGYFAKDAGEEPVSIEETFDVKPISETKQS